jgi:HEAT repeat protein
MMDGGNLSQRGKREKPRRQGLARCRLALLGLAIALCLPGAARSQEASGDPVQDLRRALQAAYADVAARDRAVRQCLGGLRSLADLQRALMLVEWHESCPDEAAAAVDRANQAMLIDGFSTAVRCELRQGDPTARKAVIELLTQTAALARASGESANLVGRFGPELAEAATQGPPALRPAAARALGQIEPAVFIAVPALEGLLQAEDAELRQAAADGLSHLVENALQTLGDAAAVQRPASRSQLVLTTSSVLPTLHRGLADLRPEVRHRCLETIALTGVALARLIADPEPAATAETSDPAAMKQPFESWRTELRPLVLALRDLGPILARCVRDGEGSVRVQAAKALEEIGHARWRWQRSCAALDTPPAKSEADLLGEVLAQAVPSLVEMLGRGDVRERRTAVDALEMMGPLALPAGPALVRTVHDPDRFLRWSAIRTLGQLGPAAAPLAAADLQRLLRDPDRDLRATTATALARMGAGASAATVPVLCRELSHPDAQVRQAAAEALRALGPSAAEAVDQLRLTLRDSDEGVRRAAQAALRHITPSSPR